MSKDIWISVYEELNKNKKNSMWLKQAKFTQLDNNILTLSFGNNLLVSNYKKFFEKLTIEKFKEITGQIITIEYKVNEDVNEDDEIKEVKNTKKDTVVNKTKVLGQNYTFDNFITCNSTKFAYQISLAVAMNPGVTSNPLLIYGGVGLGKTHLLSAIGNYIKENDPSKKVVQITAETFTNEYLDSVLLKRKDVSEFRYKYRKADVLLIDDIHFMQEKAGSQEEFFHTFNDLYESGRQIVMTCDRPIDEMKGLTDRIRNRFTRGVTANLKMSDYETRNAILLKKANDSKKHLPMEIIDYIAQNVQTNIRDLEACLNTLLAYQSFEKNDITKDVAKELMSSIVSSNFASKQDYSIDEIVKEVCAFFKVTMLDIKSKKRNALISNARQLSIYIVREVTNLSFSEIGHYFTRDHSTIIHAYNSIKEGRIENSELNNNVSTLLSKFNK